MKTIDEQVEEHANRTPGGLTEAKKAQLRDSILKKPERERSRQKTLLLDALREGYADYIPGFDDGEPVREY